jgi:NADP-dependent 3-hydroxy acid dehydrogenase YdfG
MLDEKNRKVALVTGASGGIGREIADLSGQVFLSQHQAIETLKD